MAIRFQGARIGTVGAVALAVTLAFACDKKEEKKETPAATGAAAETKPAAAAAKPEEKKADDKKADDHKKKLPPKTAAKGPASHGKKGGDGADKPNDKSHKAGNESTHSDKKHKVEAADHPCEKAPDGAAECKGASLFFCSGKELYELDCKAFMTGAHPDLFTDGTCFETDGITDCLGAGQAEDGTVVACTSDFGLCCADDGSCYSAPAK